MLIQDRVHAVRQETQIHGLHVLIVLRVDQFIVVVHDAAVIVSVEVQGIQIPLTEVLHQGTALIAVAQVVLHAAAQCREVHLHHVVLHLQEQVRLGDVVVLQQGVVALQVGAAALLQEDVEAAVAGN